MNSLTGTVSILEQNKINHKEGKESSKVTPEMCVRLNHCFLSNNLFMLRIFRILTMWGCPLKMCDFKKKLHVTLGDEKTKTLKVARNPLKKYPEFLILTSEIILIQKLLILTPS